MREPIRRWGPPLAWMTLIFILSAQPSLPGPTDTFWDTLLKKTGHFVVYAVLARLYLRAMNAGGKRGRWMAWGLAVLYAASDELHQSFVPGRHARLTDVLIDAAGAATLWLRRPRT